MYLLCRKKINVTAYNLDTLKGTDSVLDDNYDPNE